MAKAITDYTKGDMNLNDFKGKLTEYNVKVDTKLDQMIRKHEVGDFVSYNEFGKHIFRNLNGYIIIRDLFYFIELSIITELIKST